MRRNLHKKQLLLIAIGVTLTTGCVGESIFRRGPISPLLVPLPAMCAAAVAGACFWLRARDRDHREQIFWKLWAIGCWLWMAASIVGPLFHSPSPLSNVAFFALAFTFLPQIVLMAALVMQPEVSQGQLRDPLVHYETALIALWWTYLYALILSPWQWPLLNAGLYWAAFTHLHDFQNVCLAAWLAGIALVTRGAWRRLYAHLAGALVLLAVAIEFFYRAWDNRQWMATMFFQALLAVAFLWLARSSLIPTTAGAGSSSQRSQPTLGAGAWLASITAIGIPALAFWSSDLSSAPESVRRFRLFVCFVTLIVAMLLLYRWQDVAEGQRERLVGKLETSVQELRRLQGNFAEAEKLASLGQLAAGAAHEINNPVAAMLGYSELLRSDSSASEHAREFGRKIGDQARRIRALVHSLISMAEESGHEAEIIDIAMPLRGAIELVRITAGQRNTNISLSMEPDCPVEVRGDPEKLLRVFYRLLLALSEGQNPARVEVKVRGHHLDGHVKIDFSGRPVFDLNAVAAQEAFRASRVPQGEELSLNVCYTIVKEHGGTIVHESQIGGGKSFRIELPAAPAMALPSSAAVFD